MTLSADTAIRPFRLAIDESAIVDLKRRLAQVRWPDEAPEPPWRYGTSVGFMRELVDYGTGCARPGKCAGARNFAYPDMV